VAWFVVWTSIQTILLYYYEQGFAISLIDSILSNFLLLLAVYVSNNMFRFYKPKSGERFQRLIWGLAFTFLAVYALQFVLQQVFPKETIYLAFLHKSLPLRFVFFLLLISWLQISRWVVQYDQEQQEKKLRETEYTGLAKEAELSKLRLQLQPHFLFNSLNSINALVGSKPQEARKMIQQLSDFLRGTIKHEDRSLIPFKDELVHLNLYLEIEKVRFGNRLQTEIECNEEANALLIPALLLQPVVENAIKFGLYDTIDAITIRIKAEISNNQLIVKVENPFDPDTQSVNKGTGFGLSSVQRRLYLLFAQSDLVVIRKDQNVFTTIIKIPQS
jgi:sensor histidine kinase YesM